MKNFKIIIVLLLSLTASFNTFADQIKPKTGKEGVGPQATVATAAPTVVKQTDIATKTATEQKPDQESAKAAMPVAIPKAPDIPKATDQKVLTPPVKKDELTPAAEKKGEVDKKKVEDKPKEAEKKELAEPKKTEAEVKEPKKDEIKAETKKVEVTPEVTPSEVKEPEEKPIELSLEAPVLPIQEGERINWLSVRKWYEHAQGILKDIQDLMPSVVQIKEQYITQRDDLDEKEENIFVPFGFDFVKLLSLVDYITDQIDQKTKELQEDIEQDDQLFIKKLSEKLDDLEELKKDLAVLRKTNEIFDNVIKLVIEQINRASSFEKNSQGYFDKIPQGTMQAKEAFYHMDSLYKTIQKINDYLSNSLLVFFNGQAQKKKDLLNSLNQKLGDLKKSGIELSSTAQRFEKISRDLEQKRAQRERGEMPEEEKAGFFGRIFNGIASFFGKLYHMIPGVKAAT